MQQPVGLNVHVYPTAFEYESRMLKITKTLVDLRFVDRVLIIAMAKGSLQERQRIDGAREVLRVRTRINGKRPWMKYIRFVEWSFSVAAKLRSVTIDMVNCHSLSVLPLCVVLKWWHKCILIYEPHELETETATSRGIRKRIAKWVEKSLLGQTDRVIVVSDSIAEHYRRDYCLTDVDVILNVPEEQNVTSAKSNTRLRECFKIPNDHMLFMYQGVFENSRGISCLLDAFRRVSPNRHLVLMGFGPMLEEIQSATMSAPNIHFHPPVSPMEIIHYTKGADVGFALLSDDCLNHRCALPNKLFHYLHSGLPVIVSDLGEMGALVDRYKCGWRVANNSWSIAQCISSIDVQAIDVRRTGALAAIKELTWPSEANKLEAIYRNLLSFGLTGGTTK